MIFYCKVVQTSTRSAVAKAEAQQPLFCRGRSSESAARTMRKIHNLPFEMRFDDAHDDSPSQTSNTAAVQYAAWGTTLSWKHNDLSEPQTHWFQRCLPKHYSRETSNERFDWPSIMRPWSKKGEAQKQIQSDQGHMLRHSNDLQRDLDHRIVILAFSLPRYRLSQLQKNMFFYLNY